jgi:putative membrane protein
MSDRAARDGAGGQAGRLASRGHAWRSWWHPPKEIRAVGEEPDYRFTLANERTFLAWLRTSLALLAGGVAVIQLVPNFAVPGGRHILGFALLALSILVAVSSYRHWAESERALRLGKPLPPSVLPRTLGAGVALVSLVALILLLAGVA